MASLADLATRIGQVIKALTLRVTALERDTGWRDITSLMTFTPSSGQLFVRRIGARVSLRAGGLVFPSETSGTIAQLPEGFRPSITEVNTARGLTVQWHVTTAGNVQIYGSTTARIEGSIDLTTTQPWPATYPGSIA